MELWQTASQEFYKLQKLYQEHMTEAQIHVLESQKQKVILDFMVFLCINKLHSGEIQFWRRMPKSGGVFMLPINRSLMVRNLLNTLNDQNSA